VCERAQQDGFVRSRVRALQFNDRDGGCLNDGDDAGGGRCHALCTTLTHVSSSFFLLAFCTTPRSATSAERNRI
jgi:hypothetical protein